MTIEDIIINRGIEEILHFTTNKGVTGILAAGVVLSRKRLPADKHLEHIYLYNCPNRSRDRKWHDYINLSITSVNRYLFGISQGNWHSDMDGFWAILSFSPEILTHPGVYFTTTNNAYSDVKRDQGPEGLEALFANTVSSYGSVIKREPTTPKNQPTCRQAEVLYPGQLSINYLKRIYVDSSDHACAIESQFDVLPNLPRLGDCIVKHDLFNMKGEFDVN